MSEAKFIIYEDYYLMDSDAQQELREAIAEEREMDLDKVTHSFASEDHLQEFDNEFDECFGNWQDIVGDRPVVVTGELGLWDGKHEIVPQKFDDLSAAVSKCLEDYNCIWEDSDGNFHVDAHHHDGLNHFTIYLFDGDYRNPEYYRPINYLKGGE